MTDMERDDTKFFCLTLIALLLGLAFLWAVSYGGYMKAKEEENTTIQQLRDSIRDLRLEMLERANYE